MKLTSKTKSMMVDFYPIKKLDGSCSKEWFLKILSFNGKTQSKKYLNRIEMNLEIRDYIQNHNYDVVDFNVIPQLANPFS